MRNRGNGRICLRLKDFVALALNDLLFPKSRLVNNKLRYPRGDLPALT
jgi:hypothetical protein